jgi:hypothetical protein
VVRLVVVQVVAPVEDESARVDHHDRAAKVGAGVLLADDRLGEAAAGPDRRGAGSIPAFVKIAHSVDGAILRPRPANSPAIRRYPQVGLSAAIRSTSWPAARRPSIGNSTVARWRAIQLMPLLDRYYQKARKEQPTARAVLKMTVICRQADGWYRLPSYDGEPACGSRSSEPHSRSNLARTSGSSA